jgi:predicted unusual protein kinase regulating ubiquinone biosynthesis (AarF/ABC1/UbiB family)
MLNIFKKPLFIINVFFITITEIILYSIFKNYGATIERVTERLASINILYVKLFQALALNNNLIDDKMNNYLLKFTDNAPWTYDDIDMDYILQFCQDNELELCDKKPMNSGMISLVFKGQSNKLKKPLVLKIKRRNIEQKLNDAIENLKFCMYLLSFIPMINNYHVSQVINNNIDIIKSQTNFKQETKNMVNFYNIYSNLRYVKIPWVYQNIKEKYDDIILMEYIEGVKINEIEEQDYEIYAKLVMKFGFASIVHGVTHGDLHAGNILFIKNKNTYKIGVIDFGIIYEINSKYKETFFDILTGIFNQSAIETSKKLLNSGIIEPIVILNNLPLHHYNSILNFTTEIVEETINNSKKANQLQIYKFLSKLKEYLNKNEISQLGLRPSAEFLKIQLVLAMSHGVTLSLCKDNFIELADTVISELFHTNILIE